MMLGNTFVNELEIKNKRVFLFKVNCLECNRLINRGECYWAIKHNDPKSENHIHAICTICASSIEQAESLFMTFNFIRCDFYRKHVNKIQQMKARPSQVPPYRKPHLSLISNEQQTIKTENCFECGKTMSFKKGTYSCYECDVHYNADCAKLDEFCKNIDWEKVPFEK